MSFIILTSNKPGKKPMLVRLDDISAVEPGWDNNGSRIVLRPGNNGTIDVDNCVEDVIARIIAAAESKPTQQYVGYYPNPVNLVPVKPAGDDKKGDAS